MPPRPPAPGWPTCSSSGSTGPGEAAMADQNPDPRRGMSAPPPAEERDPLAEVVAALSRAGLDPGATELADALWLARWSRPSGALAAAASEPGRTGAADTGGATFGRADGQPGDRTPAHGTVLPPLPPAPPDDRLVTLYPGAGAPGRARTGTGAAALTVAVPEAPALPRLLELQSAPRPLQRCHNPARPPREVLDESANAEHNARAAVVP